MEIIKPPMHDPNSKAKSNAALPQNGGIQVKVYSNRVEIEIGMPLDDQISPDLLLAIDEVLAYYGK